MADFNNDNYDATFGDIVISLDIPTMPMVPRDGVRLYLDRGEGEAFREEILEIYGHTVLDMVMLGEPDEPQDLQAHREELITSVLREAGYNNGSEVQTGDILVMTGTGVILGIDDDQNVLRSTLNGSASVSGVLTDILYMPYLAAETKDIMAYTTGVIEELPVRLSSGAVLVLARTAICEMVEYGMIEQVYGRALVPVHTRTLTMHKGYPEASL